MPRYRVFLEDNTETFATSVVVEARSTYDAAIFARDKFIGNDSLNWERINSELNTEKLTVCDINRVADDEPLTDTPIEG